MKLLTKCRYPYRNKRILFLLPSLSGVSIFVLLPFLDVVRRSFTGAVSGKLQGVANYVTVFQNQAFQLAAKNSLRFVMICLPILILTSLLTAALLSRVADTQVYKSAYLLPMAVPAATVVLIWKLLFHKQGLINGLLVHLGQPPLDFMGTAAAFWVLVISYIWKNFGITVVLWLAGIYSIPEQITEAAKVDGAGEWTCFFRIVMPNLKPVLYTITVFSFINSFKVFREAYLVAGSYPHESMYMLQHLFNNWFLNLDLDKMAAAAVCLTIILTIVILLLSRLWDKAEER